MGLSSRQKGKRGERRAAEAWQKFIGIATRRGQQYNGIDGQDIVSEDMPGVHREVKYGDLVPKTLYQFYNQAVTDAGDDAIPIVLLKRTDTGYDFPWMVLVDLRDLMPLLEQINDGKRRSELRSIQSDRPDSGCGQDAATGDSLGAPVPE